jgi:hypothetical protein
VWARRLECRAFLRSRGGVDRRGGGLVEEHGAVEGVALDGLEAGFADDAAKFFFRSAAGFAEALFEQNRADVVAAEAETHLQDLEALRGPGALEVRDVVEVEAADGEGGEVLDCGGLGDIETGGGVGERGEAGEAAGFFLETTEQFEMGYPLFEGFSDAEDHGRCGAEA